MPATGTAYARLVWADWSPGQAGGGAGVEKRRMGGVVRLRSPTANRTIGTDEEKNKRSDNGSDLLR